MNTTAKGRRNSTKAKHYAESQGYEVYVVPHTRWSKDAFGLFDQIWVKRGAAVFVQVKSNEWGCVTPLKKWSKRMHQRVLLLRWDDRKGWRERMFVWGTELWT